MKSNPALHRRGQGITLVQLLVVAAIIGVAVALLLPATRNVQPAARRTQCRNNLKNIVLALHAYHEDYGSFPPAYSVGADGNPLHCWRTLILPYFDQTALYGTIDLTKPWDDPANEMAYKTAVAGFQCPSSDIPPTYTTYMAIVGTDFALQPVQPRSLAEITDPHAETILLVDGDAAHAVHWMAPQDFDEQRLLELGVSTELAHPGVFTAAMVDGSVRMLSAKSSAQVRHAWVTINGSDNEQSPQ